MIYIILAMLAYTSSIMLSTAASRSGNTFVVAAIINIVSAIAGTAFALTQGKAALTATSRLAVTLAILCGIGIAVFSASLTKSYSVNKVGIVVPIVFGGAIFLSALLSLVIFKEKITPAQGLGLIAVGIGLSLVAYGKATGK